MRFFPRILATAAALSLASGALASDQVVTAAGTIKSVDMFNHSITLTDGSIHKLARGVSLKGVKAGQKVTLTFSRVGPTPQLELSAINPAEE